jgi:hypothetical protein
MKKLINDVEYVYDQHHRILKMKQDQKQLEPRNNFKTFKFSKEYNNYFMKHYSHKYN